MGGAGLSRSHRRAVDVPRRENFRRQESGRSGTVPYRLSYGLGGNPEKEAICIDVTPAKNEGKTIHELTVKDVPVDGFWSIGLYNARGYFEKNDQGAYSVNNLTAKKDADGSVTVQFGGCHGKTANCLPIRPGWNYLVRLYRLRPEILNGKWKFPEAQPVS